MGFSIHSALHGVPQFMHSKYDQAIDWEKTHYLVEKLVKTEENGEGVLKEVKETFSSSAQYEELRDEAKVVAKDGQSLSPIEFTMPTRRELLVAMNIAGIRREHLKNNTTEDVSEEEFEELMKFEDLAFLYGSLCIVENEATKELGIVKENYQLCSRVKEESIGPVAERIITELGDYIMKVSKSVNPQ